MPKLKTVRVRRELIDRVEKALEKDNCKSLSEFVSEAIQLRLLRLEKSQIIGVREYKCRNRYIHSIKVVRYGDSSIWVRCPMFGWFDVISNNKNLTMLGCKDRKKRCTWFVG
ncbi:MAG: hypothetical protein JSV51_08065 [Candidatus Bathyarchaeota archaeon]|nr:MAG: hypothetical protein JSV51_08065 [Candidatus Bathyarchaeota archaeon]